MHIASKHLHLSILTGLVVLGGLTVSFAAAQTESPVASYAHSFILAFPNNITEGPFAGAKFDIGAYMSHPCFQIAGVEAQSCKDQFGVTQSLRTFVDDGSLLAYLNERGLLARSMTSSVSSSSTTGSSLSSMSSSSSSVSSASSMSSSSSSSMSMESSSSSMSQVSTDVNTIRQQRSDLLWDICSEMAKNDRAESSDCYQRNMSLLQRINVPLRGNVY